MARGSGMICRMVICVTPYRGFHLGASQLNATCRRIRHTGYPLSGKAETESEPDSVIGWPCNNESTLRCLGQPRGGR